MDLVAIVHKAFDAKRNRYADMLDSLQSPDKFQGVVGNVLFGLSGLPPKGESDPLFTLYEPLPWEETHTATLIAPNGARLHLDRNPDPAPGVKSYSALEVSITGAECAVVLEDGLLRALEVGMVPESGEDQAIELLLHWAAQHVREEKFAAFCDLAADLQVLITQTRAEEFEDSVKPAPAPRPIAPPPAPL